MNLASYKYFRKLLSLVNVSCGWYKLELNNVCIKVTQLSCLLLFYYVLFVLLYKSPCSNSNMIPFAFLQHL